MESQIAYMMASMRGALDTRGLQYDVNSIQAFFDGYIAGLHDYAIWKDGTMVTAMGRIAKEELVVIEEARKRALARCDTSREN